VIVCDSCDKPIEGRGTLPRRREVTIYIDSHGRRVSSRPASTIGLGAWIVITVYGLLHDECVMPRIEALIETADMTAGAS
jgi:hypothetical protein